MDQADSVDLPVVCVCCIHWQGEDFEVSSNEIEQLSMEEIQETLQIQQFKRSVLLYRSRTLLLLLLWGSGSRIMKQS